MNMTMIALTVLTLSSSAFSQTLVDFASANPSHPLPELLASVGGSDQTLQTFRCDRPNRMDLIDETVIINPERSSLRIFSDTTTVIYRDGDVFDMDGNPTRAKSGFIRQTVDLLHDLEATPHGAQLLLALEGAKYPTTIKEGGPRFMPYYAGERTNLRLNNAMAVQIMATGKMRVENWLFSEVGSGGFALWNPKLSLKTMESDGESRARTNAITIAHELFHSYDSNRGLLDLRLVTEWPGHENLEVSEYRAVYFENQVRHDMGFLYRYGYSTTALTQPGVLDANGMPVFFEAPCIAP